MDFALTCQDDACFAAHCMLGFQLPTVIVPGAYPPEVVGGFHQLCLTVHGQIWQCQVRVVWFAAESVAPPFRPAVGLGVVQPPVDFVALWQAASQLISPEMGSALVQSGIGGQHDRFPLPS